MARATSRVPDERQARAFVLAVERVGLSAFIDHLLRYGRGALHLAGPDARRKGRDEARDLLHTLYTNGAEGTLGWKLGQDATAEEILRDARLKMRELFWNLRRQHAYTHTVDDPAADARPDGSLDVLTKLIDLRTMSDLERSFEGDEEVSRYLGLVLDGRTHDQIVAELGWTERQGAAAYKRFMRGVAALRVRMNDEREAEPKAPALAGRSHA